jgi:Thioredoxin domain
MAATDITQIKIGAHKVGIVGLQNAVEELAPDFAHESDDTVAAELCKRLSRQNYIPAKVRESYGRAFLREFRKFLGQPYQKDSFKILEIKVLGPGCAQCDRLEKDVMDVLSEMNQAADLEHVRDIKEIAKYGVMGMPALIINGRIMGWGNPPPKSKIQEWLEDSLTGVGGQGSGARDHGHQ